MSSDHECYPMRPFTPEREGQQWTCPECGLLWVARYGRDLPNRPRWVDPDSLGWSSRRTP